MPEVRAGLVGLLGKGIGALSGRRSRPLAAPAWRRQQWARSRARLTQRVRVAVGRRAIQLWMLGVVAAGTGLGVTAYRTDLFRITDVQVVGTMRVKPESVIERAALSDRNLLFIDTGSVQKAIAALPQVKTVNVKRHLPHRVTLLVTERQPWGVWQQGKNRYLIDADGVIFEAAKDADKLPTIVDVSSAPLKIGDRVNPEVFTLALKIAENVPQYLNAKVVGFEYKEGAGLVVITDKGQRARIGEGEDLTFKMQAWKSIVEGAAKEGRRITHVDLRFGTRPFAR